MKIINNIANIRMKDWERNFKKKQNFQNNPEGRIVYLMKTENNTNNFDNNESITIISGTSNRTSGQPS